MITYQKKFQMKLRFFPTRINKYKTWLWETCSEMWYGQIMLNMPQRFRALGSCFYYYRTDLLIIQHLSCNQKRLLLEDKHLQYFWSANGKQFFSSQLICKSYLEIFLCCRKLSHSSKLEQLQVLLSISAYRWVSLSY